MVKGERALGIAGDDCDFDYFLAELQRHLSFSKFDCYVS